MKLFHRLRKVAGSPLTTAGLTYVLILLALTASADQVIMKDGKIYVGRVMGEGSRSILLSQPGQPPKFIELSDVMTIVREKNPEIPNPDRDRQIHLELAFAGNFNTSNQMSVSHAPGLAAVGGFRLHPLIQFEGGMDWTPEVSGELAISDGTLLRRYEHFYTWGGGFGLRAYPLALVWKSSWEPYLSGGYRWARLNAKASGDFLKGDSWNMALGISKALGRHLYWENRLVYQKASFEKVQFILREGSLNPSIEIDTWSLQTGLSLRL